MSDSKLSTAVSDALASIERIQLTAAQVDKKADDAEHRAAKAEKKAASDRKAAEEAIAKLDAAEQRAIDAYAGAAAEVAALRAQVELLARRDREARDELDRLRLSMRPR